MSESQTPEMQLQQMTGRPPEYWRAISRVSTEIWNERVAARKQAEAEHAQTARALAPVALVKAAPSPGLVGSVIQFFWPGTRNRP